MGHLRHTVNTQPGSASHISPFSQTNASSLGLRFLCMINHAGVARGRVDAGPVPIDPCRNMQITQALHLHIGPWILREWAGFDQLAV